MKLSRQRAWQLRKQDKGLCTQCGKAPTNLFSTLCDSCGKKTRERNRRNGGFNEWQRGGPGRPFKEAQ